MYERREGPAVIVKINYTGDTPSSVVVCDPFRPRTRLRRLPFDMLKKYLSRLDEGESEDMLLPGNTIIDTIREVSDSIDTSKGRVSHSNHNYAKRPRLTANTNAHNIATEKKAEYGAPNNLLSYLAPLCSPNLSNSQVQTLDFTKQPNSSVFSSHDNRVTSSKNRMSNYAENENNEYTSIDAYSDRLAPTSRVGSILPALLKTCHNRR